MAEEKKTQVTDTEASVSSAKQANGKQEAKDMVYENREELDARLSDVISDILSAEQEAKHIIERAEESAKAVAHGGAVQMRTMREESSRMITEAKAKKAEDASRRAAEEREKRVKQARQKGEKLIKEKEKAIAEQINRLFEGLGGKA